MRFGLEIFVNHPPRDLLKKRWGLLSNQASISGEGYYSKDLIGGKFQNNLRCLFSPQHGFWGTEQDNMQETPDTRDPVTELPIYSLYSQVYINYFIEYQGDTIWGATARILKNFIEVLLDWTER